MLIKDILTIDLSEDIKNVIDLEDISEAAIQSEIENYIITEGLADEYSSFASVFTSNILETGVWISGFYGSGKSYFGKLLGYLISNRTINGTPARDRILHRFTGINDEALVKNSIAKLNSINARVVFLDIAKQDTSKGFAYALFRNLLKSLELPENEHGFLLFSLMCDNGYGNVADFVQDKLGRNWDELKNNRTQYIGKIKELYTRLGNSDSDYNNILTTIRREIDEFSAAKLRDELINYIKVQKDEKIVFLFDEASEAINQKKFTLLDLEGLSEALSSLGANVWTIAIAQEKLDDVINNSNLSKAQLTKVTDRFKTKIHLEATEVDVIIRSRLLKKKDSAVKDLKAYYQGNAGKIAEHSSLTGAARTEDVESFVTYYPFYQNQFTLLQNFLFGRQGYASTKVAARGMIITTYDILKHEIQNETLYNVATGWQIAKEAQPQPPARLVNRYDNADKIFTTERIDLPGRHLLETVHFLTEAETVTASFNNIVKAYGRSPEDFHTAQGEIQKGLDILVEQKILLPSEGKYRITSDIEERLLEEMRQFSVAPFKKKQKIIKHYETSEFIKSLARITDINVAYDFFIFSDNDDDITSPKLKYLKLQVKSLFNIGEDRTGDIEQLRAKYQNDKDLICLIPDDSFFKEIDSLLDELERLAYLEEKYRNPNSEEGIIVRAFLNEKSTKESRLKELVEQCLEQGNSIYLYNVAQLNKNNWQSILNALQRQAIQNVYSKRLTAQVSDALAGSVIKEANNNRLYSHFTGLSSDFQFFDNQGNFIGDSLKPAEEILYKIRNTFVNGSDLEKDLEVPPTGYSLGTVMTTVSALMRGGKIMAKYNGDDKFSWKDAGVSNIFGAAREFRKASFKAIARSLSAAQKNSIVTSLQELEIDQHIGKKIDWNTNDFDLVNGVRELAKHFCDKVDVFKRTHKDFDTLFANLEQCKDGLGEFTGAVSEANYIDKAEAYLAGTDGYATAIDEINKAERFIRNNLEKLRQWRTFADGVGDELKKAARANAEIDRLTGEFDKLYKGEVVKNFSQLQQTIQKIKDGYYTLMVEAATDMSAKYTGLKTETDALIREINSLPPGLNDDASYRANNLLQYAEQRTSATVDVDFDVKDRKTRFTYSEILSFIELYISKKTELDILRAGLVRTMPTKPAAGAGTKPTVKTFTAQMPGKKLKVAAYRQWLQQELQKLAGASDNDEVTIDN